MPIEVKPKTQLKPATPRFKKLSENVTFSRKVSDKDRMFFTEQLALLLETGSNLHASLNLLQNQMDNPVMKRVVGEITDDIANGKPFSLALSAHPSVFSRTYVNLIAASESGGFVHKVLEQLLALDQRRNDLKSTLISAISYPAFLLAFALSISVFILVVIFPKFAEMFAAIADGLPATTTILMALSNLLVNYWMAICGGVAGLVLFLRFLLTTDNVKKRVDELKLSIPGLKQLFIRLYLTQSLRVMGLSMGNGVGVIDTLNSCKEIVENGRYQSFIDDIETAVKNGRGIAVSFQETEFIPAIAEQMIATGEDTGNLPKVMERLSDHYELELTNRLNALSKLAEPLMLVFMGGVVGLLVSSLILPIFKLSGSVH